MKRKSNTILTNMCMICDGNQILVQDKLGSYSGVTFPGGHIEAGESLAEAVIREVYEETGLTIENPQLCGVYDWELDDGVRYLVFIYKVIQYSGEIKSSEEGTVRWIQKSDFLNEPLAHGMDKVFEIIEGEKYTECYMELETKKEYLW